MSTVHTCTTSIKYSYFQCHTNNIHTNTLVMFPTEMSAYVGPYCLIHHGVFFLLVNLSHARREGVKDHVSCCFMKCTSDFKIPQSIRSCGFPIPNQGHFGHVLCVQYIIIWRPGFNQIQTDIKLYNVHAK